MKIEDAATVPPAILALEDGLTRQHAKDAYILAVELKALLESSYWLVMSFHLGWIVAEESQENLARLFPELRNYRQVLSAFAALTIRRRKLGCDELPSTSLLDQMGDLLVAINVLRGQKVRALAVMGVNSMIFDGPIDDIVQRFDYWFGRRLDTDSKPPSLRPEMYPPKCMEILTELDVLLDLLRNAPATALNIPKYRVFATNADQKAPSHPGHGSSPSVSTVSVSYGQWGWALKAENGTVISISSKNKVLFLPFILMIESGSPSETVSFGELNRKVGAGDDAAKASDSLRQIIHLQNKEINRYFGDPPAGNWIECDKGKGYRLNRSVRWLLSEKLANKDANLYRSVYAASVNPRIIADTYPSENTERLLPSSRGRRR
jgi:hypothetical protein